MTDFLADRVCVPTARSASLFFIVGSVALLMAAPAFAQISQSQVHVGRPKFLIGANRLAIASDRVIIFLALVVFRTEFEVYIGNIVSALVSINWGTYRLN